MLPGCWRRWKEELPPYSLLTLHQEPPAQFVEQIWGKSKQKEAETQPGCSTAQHELAAP